MIKEQGRSRSSREENSVSKEFLYEVKQIEPALMNKNGLSKPYPKKKKSKKGGKQGVLKIFSLRTPVRKGGGQGGNRQS